jgi:hypothetical protein
MSCERYWRDGVLLVEQGRPDPHRENCQDCRREHESRAELVRAFQLVGAQGGDPRWQARVWRQIAQSEVRPPKIWVAWVSAFAAACVLVLFVSTQGLLHRDDRGVADHDVRPRFDIVPSEVAVRSASRGIGDRVRIWVGPDQEARIYRAEKLLLRCTEATAAATAGCKRDEGGLRAELLLELPGTYQLVIAPAESGTITGSFDADLGAIAARGGTYQVHDFTVH